LANIASARKRARQAAQRRQHNVARRSMLRTQTKKTLRLMREGERGAAALACRQTDSLLDRLAGKRLIHRNTAARHKSRLNRRLRALGGERPQPTTPPRQAESEATPAAAAQATTE